MREIFDDCPYEVKQIKLLHIHVVKQFPDFEFRKSLGTSIFLLYIKL